MTRKKDLKKAQSKKKTKKNKQRNIHNKEVTNSLFSIENVVSNDKKIAIISLIQTSIMMLFSFALIFVKPDSTGFWGVVLKQNNFLDKNFFTAELIFCVEAILAAITIFFIYKSIVNKKLRRFYNSSILITAIALVYCMVENNDKFIVYSYGLFIALFIGILQVSKLYFVKKLLVQYKDEIAKEEADAS